MRGVGVLAAVLLLTGCASGTPPTTRTVVDWDEYPAEIRAEIDQMQAEGNCSVLRARYGITLNEGGAEDLLAYIDEALILADCPR